MGQVDIIRASAGSGKTYRLAYEYVKRMIKDPSALYTTLAVTFTNKATEQMKSRILKELHTLSTGNGSPFTEDLQDALWLTKEEIYERAKKSLDTILHNYSFFSVYTIDRFFQKILRAFAAELSLDGDYRIELDQSYLLEMAIDALMNRAADDLEIKNWLEEYTSELVESGAGYQIESAIAKVATALLDDNFDIEHAKIAPQERIEFLKELFISVEDKYEQMRLMAIECKETMEHLGLGVDSFTQKKRGLAGYILKMAEGNFAPYNNFVKAALEPTAKWGKGKEVEAAKATMQPMLCKLCAAWDKNIRYINSVEAIKRHWRTYTILSDLSHLLDEASQSKRAMLLSRASSIITRLVEGNDAPFIYEKIGNRYNTFMIDEFQDTSLAQWNNFVPLMSDAISSSDQESHSVLFVGDVKQSIYGWRGGDWSILERGVRESLDGFADQINEETLPCNWRSLKAIVEFNNTFIKEAAKHMNTLLNEDLPSSSIHRDILPHIYRDMYQEPALDEGGRVEAHICDFQAQENLCHMVRHIKELQDAGCPAGDIAIIVRTNAEAQSVADYLLAQKSDPSSREYCFDIVSAEALRLDSSPIIKFLMAAFSLVIKDDTLSKAIITGYLGKRDITSDLEYLASLKVLSPIELLEELMEHYSADSEPSNQAYLQILYDIIIDYCNREIPDVRGFMRWWRESGSSKKISLPEGGDAISIITTHKSKGLEYKAVIIPYMDWSYSERAGAVWAESNEEPFDVLGKTLIHYSKNLSNSSFNNDYYAIKNKSAIEAFNILYVAVTRACSSLMFTLPSSPRGIGKVVKEALSSESLKGIASYADETSFIMGDNIPSFTKKDKGQKIIVNHFEGSDFKDRIKIHLSSKRDDDSVLSPRAKGLMLHRVFENANTKEDILSSVKQLLNDGLIAESEADRLSFEINRQLENPLIASWFDSKATIYCERDIIPPSSMKKRGSMTRRPDRVVIKDGCCTVIDYKFGSHKDSYKNQIREYVELLKNMGLNVVGAYLWYFSEDKIVNCI